MLAPDVGELELALGLTQHGQGAAAVGLQALVAELAAACDDLLVDAGIEE